MPYIHNDLGVPCMTQSEFWNSLARQEGKDSWEVIEDFYSEIADDQTRSANELLNDKSQVLKMLLEYYNSEYGDVDFIPTEVEKVIDASVSYSIKKSVTNVTAIVKCNDGKTRTVECLETYWSGSYMDPPEYECECRVIVE